MENISILILDDEQRLRDEIAEFLMKKQFTVFTAVRPSEAFKTLAVESIDIAIVDIKLPEMDGIDVLKILKKEHPYLEIIMISGHGDMQSVIEAMRFGATDYFPKPFRLTEIEHAIQRTKRFVDLSRKLHAYNSSISILTDKLYKSLGSPMVGESAAMKEVVSMMQKVSQTDHTSVLILGESGTGKELVAHGIHLLSNRSKSVFHSVNCSAITDSLFESEFFGHTKGSFTGAMDDRAGWFEIADKGTLFLDEIGDMPIGQQAKLLRALEEHKVSRVGAHKQISFDVRVIAASNQPLESMSDKKEFRSDLYHRLSTFVIYLPPLRDRIEDIPLLVDYFLQQFASRMKRPTPKLTDEAFFMLQQYHFPGNIRELRNLLERAIILCENDTITPNLLPMIPHKGGIDNPEERPISFDLAYTEKTMIEKALKYAKMNKSRAAKLLNITWQTLDRKIKKHDIKA